MVSGWDQRCLVGVLFVIIIHSKPQRTSLKGGVNNCLAYIAWSKTAEIYIYGAAPSLSTLHIGQSQSIVSLHQLISVSLLILFDEGWSLSGHLLFYYLQVKRGLFVGLTSFRLISPESHIRSSPVQRYYHAQVRHVSSNYYSKREKREKRQKETPRVDWLSQALYYWLIRARNFQEPCVCLVVHSSSNPARTTSLPDTHKQRISACTGYSIISCSSPTSIVLLFTHTHRTHSFLPTADSSVVADTTVWNTPASVTASPLTTHCPLQSIFFYWYSY